VHEFDPSPAIKNVDRPVVVVSCYSDRTRVVSRIYDPFIILVQNSYVLGFLHHLSALWLFRNQLTEEQVGTAAFGLAKKFVGEQMLRIAPSSIARVLILESVLECDSVWRKPLLAKERAVPLRRSANRLTQLASDFILHHELGSGLITSRQR
jgi:hypothetical protein